MVKNAIKIDREKCVGCGLCVNACHQGAIAMVNGKAKMMREDYCDGLGRCLPVCPTGAITFEERDFENTISEERADMKEIEEAKPKMKNEEKAPLPCGCPGSNSKMLERNQAATTPNQKREEVAASTQLRQWPVQIQLVPVNAPYFENANILVAADCAAYAYGNFHNEFMKNKITIIGCPKLDDTDYSIKLTEILKQNNIKSVTVVRMEVPCCGGIEQAVKTALQNCGKLVQWQAVTISTNGEIIE